MKSTYPNAFFVYGTLRPDITAPWSDSVHKNSKFKLKYHKASLSNSKLYMHKSIGYPVCLYDKQTLYSNDETIGYILETDNIKDTLSLFDSIEEYPDMYDRIIVECFNIETKKYVQAYFYTPNPKHVKTEELIDINVNDYSFISVNH